MMHLKFGREVCSDRKIAQSREWLVTNGIGGYASGTISGILTRRYHGLLVAALNPPVARTLLLSKLDETISYQDQTYELSANLWADGTILPQGFINIESFQLVGTTPVWQFAFADGLLEKSIWMEQGENTTYIRYIYKRGSQPLTTRCVAPALAINSASSQPPSMVFKSATIGTSGYACRSSFTASMPCAIISGVPTSSQSMPASKAIAAVPMASATSTKSREI